MASAIDITKPVAGNPLTATVRANFTAAASEITALQAAQALKAPLAAPDLTGAATAVDLTVSGTLDATGAFQLNSVAVTSTAAELNILDGVTATAAELNILDGVTATAAELNFSDGVTSNIQTQLDTKTGAETKSSINALAITELGTVDTGVWNGTAISATYLVNQSGTNTGDETLSSINALNITNLGTVDASLTVLTGTTAGVTLPSSYSTIVADGTNAGLTLTATGTGFAGLNWANDSGANDANIVVKSSDREMRFIVAAAERMRIKSDGVINFSDMPTASAGLASGDLWSDSGTIKIVA
jgi:hypothetical protein